MKKLLIFMLTVLFVQSVLADQCLSPSHISISKNPATGKFDVNLPAGSGYQYIGDNYPISASGPISFVNVKVMSRDYPSAPSGPYSNIFAERDIECTYGVDESSTGSYPGGIFILSKTASRGISYDLSEKWSYRGGFYYICWYDAQACHFNPH